MAVTIQKRFNPYPGLRPFQKEEASLFFGREKHIGEILRKLNTFRFVSIVGNSGSGKSSLVRAGILPGLENSEQKEWLICTMKPGKNAISGLSAGLKQTFNIQLPDTANLLNTLSKSKLGLVQVLRYAIPEGKKLLLLIDQFEELFRFLATETTDQKINEQFVDLLLGAISQKDVPVYVMLTLRSDFLGDCEQFLGLPEAINDGQFLIPRMNRQELELSITGPAALAGFKLSPRLVQNVLNDLGNSHDQLPVMQHALMRTYDVWHLENDIYKPVDLEHYEKTGCMEKALSNHAEEAFAELNTERKQYLAACIFKTITVKGADNRGVRRPTSIKKLSQICSASVDEIIEVANVFRREDRGFVMPSLQVALTENNILDISHESLMRVWERLKNWVNEEAEATELYQRITNSALLYEKNRAGLWRDPDLQIALDWREKISPNEAWALQYNTHFDVAMRFIEASLQEKKFMLAEKKRNKILLRSIVGIAIVALSMLTIWALSEQQKSVASEQTALTEKQKAEQQSHIAVENARRAEAEKQKAQTQKTEAEKQKKFALINEQEAKLQKLKAEQSSLAANDARKRAEIDKQIAVLQKQISDSLKVVSEKSEKNAYRLRILSVAQNLAIKSEQAQKGTYDDDALKPLLALQAYNFTNTYNRKKYDPEIFKSLFLAGRFIEDERIYSHNLHKDVVRACSYSPDGKFIATTGNDGLLIICDAVNLQNQPKYFTMQPFILENLAYNNDGTRIACSSDNKNILVYEANLPAKQPVQINTMHTDKVSALLWLGNYVVTSSLDMSIHVLDVDASNLIKAVNLESKPLCISLLESKNILAIGCENGTIYQLNLKIDNDAKVLKKISNNRITSIDFNADGSELACGTSEGALAIIYTNNPARAALNLPAHKASITCVRFAKNKNNLATTGLDGVVRLWNLNYVDDQPQVFAEHESWIYCLCFNNDGSRLVSCGKDKSVRTYVVDENILFKNVSEKVKRNFTDAEWDLYVGNDIPYERTIKELR
ncbi:MAG: hypothetical protein Q8M15_05670 [Bacteroidota bacterium]|nr:hypothetical protein [Bacteroidota bacterium]